MNTKLRSSDDARSIRVNRRLERWRARVRRSGEWISFGEITDWIAREPGSIIADEQLRTAAYQALYQSLIDGDFEVNGRSCVAYPDGLFSDRPWIRMTRDSCEAWPEDTGDRIAILDSCWVPSDLARRWLERRRLPIPSELRTYQAARGVEAGKVRAAEDVVNGVTKTAAATSPLNPRNAGGRPATYKWDDFMRELLRLANTPDGLPERPATTKHMQEWCARNWEREPSESVIRDKIARVYPPLQ